MRKASTETSAIIAQLYSRLDAAARLATRIVTDVDVLEEVFWSELADFYFCHGGSMQNKIGWVHDTPGVIHSNESFITSCPLHAVADRQQSEASPFCHPIW